MNCGLVGGLGQAAALSVSRVCPHGGGCGGRQEGSAARPERQRPGLPWPWGGRELGTGTLQRVSVTRSRVCGKRRRVQMNA